LSGAVNVLKFHPNGDLLIGGTFTNADGTNGDYICKLPAGTDALKSFTDYGASELSATGYVYAIDVTPDGTIVIGGQFTDIGGDDTKKYLVKWGGTNWANLGNAAPNLPVFDIRCETNGSITISGSFSSIGNLTAKRVVVYKNGAYQPLDIDLPGTTRYIYAIFEASDG